MSVLCIIFRWISKISISHFMVRLYGLNGRKIIIVQSSSNFYRCNCLSHFISPSLLNCLDRRWYIYPSSQLYGHGTLCLTSTDNLSLNEYDYWELMLNIYWTCIVLAGFYFAFLFKLSPLETIFFVFFNHDDNVWNMLYLNFKAIKQR